MKCYVCDDALNKDNETDEHIIINAIGGRLKSKKLLCRDCNSDFGAKIDTKLAKELNIFANMLMIRRDRGNPQEIIGTKESTNEQYSIDYQGKINLTKPSVKDDGEEISIVARNKKELRKILKGFIKKYPDLNVDELTTQAEVKNERFKEKLHFQPQIGGKEIFQAVCKCAVNFYVDNINRQEEIKHLISYIKNEESLDVVNFCFTKNIYKLDNEEALHILHIVGDKKERILYAYIDYFNVCKYIVLLNDKYLGENISFSYCFDLINMVEIKKKINLKYTRSELLKLIKSKERDYQSTKESFERFLNLALTRQDKKIQTEYIRDSINEVFDKYSDVTKITPKIMDDIHKSFMKRMTPYIVNRMGD